MGNGNGSAGGAWIRGAPIAGGAERCWRPQQRSHCDEMDGGRWLSTYSQPVIEAYGKAGES